MAAIIDVDRNLWIGETYDDLRIVSLTSDVVKVSTSNKEFLVNDADGHLFILKLENTGAHTRTDIAEDADFVDVVLSFTGICGLNRNGTIRWWDSTFFNRKPLHDFESELDVPEKLSSIMIFDRYVAGVSISGNIYSFPDVELIHNAKKTGIKAARIKRDSDSILIIDTEGYVYLKGHGVTPFHPFFLRKMVVLLVNKITRKISNR